MGSIRSQTWSVSRSCLWCRLDDEVKARKVLEKDVDNLKKTYEDTQLDCKQTQKEIHLVEEELQRLDQDHKNVSVTRASRAGEGAQARPKTQPGPPRRWMICARRSKSRR